MGRRKRTAMEIDAGARAVARPAPPAKKQSQPVRPEVRPAILPTAIYNHDEARKLLRVRKSRLMAEVDAGRLRCRMDGTRRLFLGEWLLQWVRLD